MVRSSLRFPYSVRGALPSAPGRCQNCLRLLVWLNPHAGLAQARRSHVPTSLSLHVRFNLQARLAQIASWCPYVPTSLCAEDEVLEVGTLNPET